MSPFTKNSFIIVSIVSLGLACFYALRAQASYELDRRYGLETVGVLKSWDNVDDLFADYVENAYREYFRKQSRFQVRDIKPAVDVLLKSQLSYLKIVDDAAILGQVSRTMKVESLIRTKIYKEGPQYRFVLDWLLSPKMELLANHTFRIDQPRSGVALSPEEINRTLRENVEKLVAKVPFAGHVTGRDEKNTQWVTVNLGNKSALRKGDILVIGTLEDVKKHPLLGSIVEWNMVETGRLVVEQVDEKLAFCKVMEEKSERAIESYQKIMKVLPRTEESDAVLAEGTTSRGRIGAREVDETGIKKSENDQPTLGWAQGGLWLGTFSRSYSNASTSRDSGGLLVGVKADSQIWLTREYFAELQFAYGFFSGGNVTRIQIDAGYNYFVNKSFYGPKGFVRMGYHTTSADLTVSTADLTGPLSVGALFLGIGGELPVRSGWSAVLNFDIGLIKSMTETGLNSGSDTGITDVAVFLGAMYRWKPKMTLRVGVDLIQNGVDFSSGATVSHRVFSFGPALVYYF